MPKELIFKNKDIIKSNIFSKTLLKNEISVREGKVKTKFTVYHILSNPDTKWSGRWYNSKITKKSFQWNEKKHQITYVIPEWEKEYKTKLVTVNDVPITITLTEKAYNELFALLNGK